jgi:hypothetical protein
MDLPRGQVGSQVIDWKTHIEEAKNFAGTDAEYCRQHGLKPSQFVYYKEKYASSTKFAQVIPVQKKTESSSSYPQNLPDPRWFCEVIHNLLKLK